MCHLKNLLKVFLSSSLEFVSATRILVTTGWTENGTSKTSKSVILTLRQMVKRNEIQLTYEPVQDYFCPLSGGFGVNCKGLVFCGGGTDSSKRHLKSVFEWKYNQFLEVKSLNLSRSFCSAVYYPLDRDCCDGLLIVAGGEGKGKDTIEYLIINDYHRSNEWRLCKDKLPYHLHHHQMNIYQGKLILTGGYTTGEVNEICNSHLLWEGNLSFEEELRVKWTTLPNMLECRDEQTAVVINDKLFCIGIGDIWCEEVYVPEYFSFTENVWKRFLDLPFTHCCSLWLTKAPLYF